MAKQASFDSYQVRQLYDLLERGSTAVEKTEIPIVLYRQVLEESEGSFEEIICTLTQDYVIEQRQSSGGPLPPTIHHQQVFKISQYPKRLFQKSAERFANVIELLEDQLD